MDVQRDPLSFFVWLADEGWAIIPWSDQLQLSLRHGSLNLPLAQSVGIGGAFQFGSVGLAVDSCLGDEGWEM